MWGSIKVYLNTSISKKERGLSEAVSTNLMQQLGSLKDTFDTYLKQKLSLHELYSQILLNVSGEGKFDSNLFQS